MRAASTLLAAGMLVAPASAASCDSINLDFALLEVRPLPARSSRGGRPPPPGHPSQASGDHGADASLPSRERERTRTLHIKPRGCTAPLRTSHLVTGRLTISS